MSEFNFKSQVCTDKIQSERLLALGLKKETADMRYDCIGRMSDTEMIYREKPIIGPVISYYDIPAWSMHRLIEMMPNEIRKYDSIASLIVSNVKVQYYLHDVEYSKYHKSAGLWKEGNIYDNLISCIEWLIKEGYFNKEYLV